MEQFAKHHIKEYFKVMERGQNEIYKPKINENGKQTQKQVMVEALALEFFGSLLESYENFKDYCTKNDDKDCAIIDTDWYHLNLP